jgi:hypothetical protein
MSITELTRTWTAGRLRAWLERCADCGAGLALAVAPAATLTGGGVQTTTIYGLETPR